jgi:ABC-type dipeptide/oligopeptide/nickel transport system ATPase subunit
MTGAIEVRDVTRVYRTGTRAVQGVSLQIPAGSRFGIVGESGSGKSTLLRMIAGLDTPTSGDVLLDGTPVDKLPAKTRAARLQMVFQDPMASLDPRMRIADIVAEPLRVQGVPDERARVRAALEQVGLDASMLRRYPHQFSGGQRQRISIARAVAADPQVLLADEAVSALDVTVRATVLALLDRITAERGLTLVFVSHDLSVIRRVCDTVAVLRDGVLVESGPVQTVYGTPQQDYTRELLAAVPTLQRSLTLARDRAARRAGGAGAVAGSQG